MRARTVPALALACCLALSGCLGAAGPGAHGSTTKSPIHGSDSGPPTTDRSPVPDEPIDDSGTSVDSGMAEPARLPPTAACFAADVPSSNVTAGRNDSLSGRAYPDSPDPITTEAVRNYAIAFEEAFFYNRILGQESTEEDPLSRVTAQVTRANLTRVQGGYLVRVEGLGATNYENGVHGDYGIDSLYRFTPDVIERSDGVEPDERNFSPVVVC